jgi:hypothetical protein
VYGVLRAWAKRYRRSLLVGAGLVGGGTALYYGFRYFGLTSEARKEREAALLQREAEDRAEAEYVHFSGYLFELVGVSCIPVLFLGRNGCIGTA